jgi:AraC family transcriptional regulator, regulatory protein of adaptative response / methylated-DNA-[protein]-cysteine methyltransferase
MEAVMKDYKGIDFEQAAEDYRRIEQSILFLEANYKRQPSLKEIAEHVHLSEFHFQRVFTNWVGISPKRFLQFLTKENAKRLLDESGSLLQAAYETGLSGPGRLHDLFVHCEAVTPGEYKNRGAGLQIRYGFHATPFGQALLGVTERGLCCLWFISDGEQQGAVEALRRRWQMAEIKEDPSQTNEYVARIFAGGGAVPQERIPVYLNGTNFQIKVWEALLRIPPGKVVSYHELAAHLGRPKSARAVGQAVAQNQLMYLIPCHRVIRSMGEFGNYQGGPARKKAILGWEFANQMVNSGG